MARTNRTFSFCLACCLLFLGHPGCTGDREATEPAVGGAATGSQQTEPFLPASEEPASPPPETAGEQPPPTEATPDADWDEEGYRTVFSFVDNRHLLHRYDTGLFIDFGLPSALKYVRGHFSGTHWQSGVLDHDRAVAWTDGIRSVFYFPWLEGSQDLELVVRMKATENQRMDVFLNGERSRPTLGDLDTDWEEIHIPLPPDPLQIGENKVRFHFARTVDTADHGRTAGAFDYARIQPRGQDPLESHRAGFFDSIEREDGRRALTSPVYGTLAAYLMVPPGSRFRVRLALDGAGDANATIPTVIRLRLDGSEPVELWEGTTSPSPMAVEILLDQFSNQVVRLELAGLGPVTEGRLEWIEPEIVVAEQTARPFEETSRPKNILIWLADAMRTDHFAVYSPDTRVQAPNYVRFADRCVAFRRATVQGNTSLPSSGSLMTSTYQGVHGLTSGDRRLPRDLSLLAEPFDRSGWSTGLFSSNGYVSESRGFARGSQEYRNLIHEPGRAHTERLWPAARDWIQGPLGQSWLAFVWTVDPHVPYDPPEEILAQYYSGTYNGRIRPRATGQLLDELGTGQLEGDDLRYLVALYDGEITYNDLWFGHMTEELESLHLLEDTLVVILADHGEAFFEHGRGGHGTSVFEEQVHVPLMFCHPPSLGDARWVDVEVESIDLFPTLLDLAGLEIPDSVQGVSLLDLMLDPTPVMNRPAFSYHQDFMRGVRIGRWKYILSDGESLYDLDESPLEGEDRIAEFPLVHRCMRDIMAFHLAYADRWRKEIWGYANNHTPVFAEMMDGALW